MAAATVPNGASTARIASSPPAPDSRGRGGQVLPLSRTMLSDHKSPYVGRFACDWPRLSTTDPLAARRHPRPGPAPPGPGRRKRPDPTPPPGAPGRGALEDGDVAVGTSVWPIAARMDPRRRRAARQRRRWRAGRAEQLRRLAAALADGRGARADVSTEPLLHEGPQQPARDVAPPDCPTRIMDSAGARDPHAQPDCNGGSRKQRGSHENSCTSNADFSGTVRFTLGCPVCNAKFRKYSLRTKGKRPLPAH